MEIALLKKLVTGVFVSILIGMVVSCNADPLARTNWYNFDGTMTASPGHLVITATNNPANCYATLYFAPGNAPVTLANPGNQLKLTWKFTPTGVSSGTTQTPLAVGLINTADTNRLNADGAPAFGYYAGYAAFMNVPSDHLFAWLRQARWSDPTMPDNLFDGPEPGHNFFGANGWGSPAQTDNYSGGDTNDVAYTYTMTLTRLGSSSLEVNTSIKNDAGFVNQLTYVDDHANTFSFNTATIYASQYLSGTFDTTQFSVDFNPVAASDDARVVVKDSWNDGDRSDPAAPAYAEQGADVDGDGNTESAWFNNSGGTMVATPGHLTTTITNGETYWTTYFTATNHPVTLAKAGERIKVTWAFTPSNVHGGGTTASLNFALINTQATNRLTADGPLGASGYGGYANFMYMGNDTLFGRFVFAARTDTNVVSPLFMADYFQKFDGWTQLGDSYAYAPGVNGLAYTYEMTVTRNASDGLDIESSVSGAAGIVNEISVTDDHPNTFTFDAASIYGYGALSGTYDTTLFQVDYYPVPAVQSVTNSNGTLQFTWNTKSNLTYQVQYCADLTPGSWFNYGGPLTATGPALTVADDASSAWQRFYRLILLP